MLAAFTTWPASIPETRSRGPRPRGRRPRTGNGVAPAFTRLHDFLVTRYLPACRETIAASALPNGAAMYAYNVKWHVTTNDTPQQIHEIGLAEVKRIRAEMDADRRVHRLQGQLRRLQALPADQSEVLLPRCRVAADRLSRHRQARRSRARASVRPPAADAVRRRAGARCRRAVADDRVLRAGIVRRRPAGQHVRQHLQARLAAELGDGGADAARSGAGPSHSDRARAGDARGCRSSARTPATPRLSKGGRCTRSRSATRWASTRIRTRSSDS